MYRVLFFLLLPVYQLASCGNDPSQLSTSDAHKPGESVIMLGMPYDSERDELKRSSCVTFPPVEGNHGYTTANVDFTQALTQEQIKNALGFAASGRASLGIVDISAAGAFGRHAVETSLSKSYVFRYAGNDTLVGDLNQLTLTDAGKRILNVDGLDQAAIQKALSSTDVSNEWQEECGDEFVSDVRRGAELMVALRFTFASSQAKEEFSAELGVDTLLFDLQTKLKNSQANQNKNFKVEMKTLQIGGNPYALGGIFSSKVEIVTDELDQSVPDVATEASALGDGPMVTKVEGVDSSIQRRERKEQVYAITACSADNLSACTVAMSDVMGYFSKDFTIQLEKYGPATLGYHTLSYKSAGMETTTPLVKKELRAQRKKLDRTVADGTQLHALIDDLTQMASTLKLDRVDLYEAQKTMRAWRKMVLKDAVNACYDLKDEDGQPMDAYAATARCSGLIDTLDDTIASVNAKIKTAYKIAMDFKPNSFDEWCSYATSDQTLKNSILSLRKSVAKALGNPAERDCEKLSKALQANPAAIEVLTIDHESRGPLDLRPFGDLVSVNIYNGIDGLSDNDHRIASSSVLHVKSLNLRGHTVKYLESLANLPELIFLNLADTDLLSLEPLRQFSDLSTVIVHGNKGLYLSKIEELRPRFQSWRPKAPDDEKRIPEMGFIFTDEEACKALNAYRAATWWQLDKDRVEYFAPLGKAPLLSEPGNWNSPTNEYVDCSHAAQNI